MKISREMSVVLVFVALGAVFLWYGNRRTIEEPFAPKNEKFTVVATFYPFAYLASAIGGARAVVTNLTPAGAEPHDFSPSPHGMLAISNADLMIYNGGNFEPWVERWKAGAFKHPPRMLNVLASLKGRSARLVEKDGITDPHMWMSPVVMQKTVEVIRDAFVVLDPDNTTTYTENAARTVAELGDLDKKFRDGLRVCAKSNIVVSHRAFDYLGQEYGFNVTSISGISPDEEPSPQDLVRITDLIREKDVKYIFFETTASPKLSQAVAREVGAETLVLNPLESLTPSEVELGQDYISVMTANLNNLRKALVCL